MARNKAFTVLESTEIDEAGNSVDYVNRDHRGVTLVIDNTDESGTSPTLTVTIQGKSPEGDYYDILASSALGSQAVTTLTVYPGLTASSNAVANGVLPRNWRVKWAIGGSETPTVTASISAHLHV